MKLFRPFSAAAVITLTAAALTGCSGSGTAGPGSSAERTIKIAYSVDVLDQTQNAILDAMKERVAEYNAEGKVNITLDAYDAQSSVNKQLSDIETALVKQPDVLVVSAVDPIGVLPAVEKAKAAGVKTIDKRPSNPEPEAYDVAYYTNDEQRYTEATVNWINKWLDANPGKTLKTGLIYGAPAQTAQLVRIDAIKKLSAERPDRIQIVAEGYGNWLTDKAQNITQDFLQAHPDITYVATANDIMALGASNAIAAAGRTGEVLLSGYDLTDEGIERIRGGQQSFDVGTNINDGGRGVIETAVGLVDGSFTDKEAFTEPVYSVTKENVDTFNKK